ncbi:MAG: ParB/RepB/Spo0J family partition protein [Planctomycetia bacterium]|nr:ParB/RepB/Spo0J family partition protein [Planctomycetia bacterium]
MTIVAKGSDVRNIPIDAIQRNEHNPRLIFRAQELEELAASIQEYGVLVPISVFREGHRYTLIDGERRWRASRMINLPAIPAIVYPKPAAVQNIVYMFNIHRFRKDWDPLPTAMKLEELKELIEAEEGTPPTEAQLAALTGMSRGQIRRCKLIMEIPEPYRKEILAELAKPESERTITTDLFVECQRAVRTVGVYIPKLKSLERPLRDAVIRKYRRKVIVNVVHMRMIAKIARAATRGVALRTVESALTSLIEDPHKTIEDAYNAVAWVYDVRSIQNQAKSLASLITSLSPKASDLDEETRALLGELRARISDLLGRKG